MKTPQEMSDRELQEAIYTQLKNISNSNGNMLTWVNVWSILFIIVIGLTIMSLITGEKIF